MGEPGIVDIADFLDGKTAARMRCDLRERALYNAVQLHCETGDAMAIIDRDAAVRDVLATATDFYTWITQGARDV
ncbi:hypothetical protein BST26_19425 [Mycolicibacterium insubricum]|uniref:Uncharacterized protein n=3 Tax=Mycolicibacterium insubricum TaxID=444597 RepID=A0A1X0CYA8_9MYCO|nr:hypothetical protein BST26_19425 [Mycolicibacterium insubricum]